MPVDKAIDSVQLDANLTAVADAIRVKGETAEALAFPDGFVSAIQDISTGAALNFQVVGGTTEPESPAENTIWVNTDQAITSWVFSHNQPESPSEGMVWIVNGVSGISEFDAVSDVSLIVQVAGVKQYVNGAWEMKTVKVYQNGAWYSLSIYLVKNGIDNTEKTGGWDTGVGWGYNSDVVSPTITFDDGIMKVTYPTNDDLQFGGISTKNPIDLTNYNTLEMLLSSAQATGSSYPSQGGVSALYMCLGKDTNSKVATAAIAVKESVTNKVASINISDLTGLYYIGIFEATYVGLPANVYADIVNVELKE